MDSDTFGTATYCPEYNKLRLYVGRVPRPEYETTCAAMTNPAIQNPLAQKLAYVEHGDYKHPRTGKQDYLYAFIEGDLERHAAQLTGPEVCALWFARHGPLAPEGEWLTHYRLRLAYEQRRFLCGVAGDLGDSAASLLALYQDKETLRKYVDQYRQCIS